MNFLLLSVLSFNNVPLDTARDAFIIQSGIQEQYNKVLSYGESKGKYYLNALGIESEFDVALIGYKCYNSKSITYKNISINRNSFSVRIPF